MRCCNGSKRKVIIGDGDRWYGDLCFDHAELKQSTKTFNKKSARKRAQSNSRTSSAKRPDVEILSSPIEKLTWVEFERLLALYFRNHGYDVEEPGIGGNDGGVDLVISNKHTRERTAVQAKHWTDRRHVGPNIIRELHSARMNTKPSCHFGMLITSSDVSAQARKEAQDRHIEFWHEATLEHKLEKWEKWRGKQTRRRGIGSSTYKLR